MTKNKATITCDQCFRSFPEDSKGWVRLIQDGHSWDFCDLNCVVAWSYRNGAQQPVRTYP